jgi:hypothetical protein
MVQQEKLLRIAFAAGAVTDALAIVPLLVPPLAKFMWGVEDPSGAYHFAMGYAASLMLGWTALLLWAYQRPVERRFVALLTIIVIGGLVLTEIVAVSSGFLAAMQMLPTWCLQAVLICLFAGAFHRRTVERCLVAQRRLWGRATGRI